MIRLALSLSLLPFAAQAQLRSDPTVMQRLWHEANAACRGGSGSDPATDKACDEREVYGKRLDQLGWCYGKKGEFGYQMRWHRCTASSMR